VNSQRSGTKEQAGQEQRRLAERRRITEQHGCFRPSLDKIRQLVGDYMDRNQ
jgi:hypothetical protein